VSSTSPTTRRPGRSRLYIIVGTVLAVVAFLAAAALASAPFLFPAAQAGTKVVVAKNAIAARTRIQASDLQLLAVSPVPPESFTAIKDVQGKGARVDIPAGEPVTANIIADSPDLLSSSDVTFLPIPSGYVAVTIPTSEQVGVGGYVQVGDRITILASVNTQAFGAGQAVLAVRTVFKDVLVLRVGAVAQTQGAATLGSSLTVLMTACDSEFLFWLLNNAVLKYELESPKDYGATPTTPDPNCESVVSAKGVGPKEVDGKWHFTTP
jgi:Flp pilus assembly protein CpaB